MSDTSGYARVRTCLQQTALLESALAVLEWDERTMMPPEAGGYRAEQVRHLAGLIHQRRTAKELGEWLEELEPESVGRHSPEGCDVYWAWRDYQRHCRLPQRLVEELAEATVLGQQAWAEARKRDDFAAFLPHLEKILRLKREQAEAWGYDEEPYDALLDEYEPGARCRDVAPLLAELQSELTPLVEAITSASRQAPFPILQRCYPIAAQREFARETTRRIGFDYSRGRLDETDHPFCTSLGPDDCRILTRYDERYFSSGFFGALHEAGHGLYDQGLPKERFGLPSGTYVSLGIHESQSRLWENAVGRSLPFWKWRFEATREAFPESLQDVSLEDFHFAVNHVRPSWIRVEADEVTYNLHIVIRFELERALVQGELAPAELPGAWNEAYERLLGIRPEDDRVGVLQDIHWSAGLIGYFPTYTLGNLYAAQLLEAADEAIGDLEALVARGEFEPLLEWLRHNIHMYGRRYMPAELIQRTSGRPLESGPLIAYLRARFEPLYGLDNR